MLPNRSYHSRRICFHVLVGAHSLLLLSDSRSRLLPNPLFFARPLAAATCPALAGRMRKFLLLRTRRPSRRRRLLRIAWYTQIISVQCLYSCSPRAPCAASSPHAPTVRHAPCCSLHFAFNCHIAACCLTPPPAVSGMLLGAEDTLVRLTFVRDRAGSDAYSQQAARERTGGGGWCGGGVCGNGQ